MVRAAQSASFVRLVAALAVVSAAPALSQACIDCCTGSGAVPDAWCLPINGCPTSGQCVNGRVTCVISTGTFACSECGAGGTRQCSPSSTGTCRPQTPRTETCNLCDDNANGVVDEGLNGVSCTTASGCNGTSSCSGGVGGCNLTASSRRPCAACAQGSQQCRAGNTFGPCQPEKETTEMCNGCDDNLNNEVDEGLSERACTMASGCSGVTQCQSGASSCVFSAYGSRRPCVSCGAGGYQSCFGLGTQLTSTSPCRPVTLRAETCDLCDDDGDGSIDLAGEKTIVRSCAQIGGCSTSTCQGGQWGTCSLPRREECNGLDDTCDGQIDDGDVCSVSTNCACAPKTCAQVPCGSPQPDGCGGVLNCSCCVPRTCGTGACGRIPDGCGGLLDCGNCSVPLCQSNQTDCDPYFFGCGCISYVYVGDPASICEWFCGP
jgi:hypothetical protein